MTIGIVFAFLAYLCHRKGDTFGVGFFLFAALLFSGAFI